MTFTVGFTNSTLAKVLSLLLPGTGDLGDRLQQLAANETAGLKPAHTYVPWVTVNGIALGGAFEQLQTFICTAYTGDRYVLNISLRLQGAYTDLTQMCCQAVMLVSSHA